MTEETTVLDARDCLWYQHDFLISGYELPYRVTMPAPKIWVPLPQEMMVAMRQAARSYVEQTFPEAGSIVLLDVQLVDEAGTQELLRNIEELQKTTTALPNEGPQDA